MPKRVKYQCKEIHDKTAEVRQDIEASLQKMCENYDLISSSPLFRNASSKDRAALVAQMEANIKKMQKRAETIYKRIDSINARASQAEQNKQMLKNLLEKLKHEK